MSIRPRTAWPSINYTSYTLSICLRMYTFKHIHSIYYYTCTKNEWGSVPAIGCAPRRPHPFRHLLAGIECSLVVINQSTHSVSQHLCISINQEVNHKHIQVVRSFVRSPRRV